MAVALGNPLPPDATVVYRVSDEPQVLAVIVTRVGNRKPTSMKILAHTRALLMAVVGCFVAAQLSGAPVAAADPQGTSLVVLGDSYTTNGDYIDVAAYAPSLFSQSASTRVDPDVLKLCPREQTSWPSQLERRIGASNTHDYTDVSCWGASLVTRGLPVNTQAKLAAQEGGFGPRTRMVAIQLGMNDIWAGQQPAMSWFGLTCAFGTQYGCGWPAAPARSIFGTPADLGRVYAQRIQNVVDYIRCYAPNARIVLVGYPELMAAGSQTLCVDVAGVKISRSGAWIAAQFLDAVDAAQRGAARLLGLDFFDTRAVTAGHTSCAADPWITGLLNPMTPLFGFTLHPTSQADAAVATGLSQLFGRR